MDYLRCTHALAGCEQCMIGKETADGVMHHALKHMHFLDVIMGSTETHVTMECQVTT